MTEEQYQQIAFFEDQLKKIEEYDAKIKLYHEYRNYVFYSDPKLALDIADRGCEYTKNNGSESDYMEMLFFKATVCSKIELFKESTEILKKCYNYFQGNQKMIVKIITSYANIFSRIGLTAHALYLFNLLDNKYIDKNDLEQKYVIKSNIIQLYYLKFEELNYSLSDIEDMISYFEGFSKKYMNVCLILELLKSRCYRVLKQYDKSIKILSDLILRLQKLNIEFILMNAYYEIGTNYLEIGNQIEMKNNFMLALKYCEKNQVVGESKFIYNLLYLYYAKKNNYKKAIEYLELYEMSIKKLDDTKSSIRDKMINLGYGKDYNFDNDLMNMVMNNKILAKDESVYIKDLKGEIHKINLKDLVYAKKEFKLLKIQLSFGGVIYTEMIFRDLVGSIDQFTTSKQMFFESNLRNQLINLFWLSRIDLSNKLIFLKTIEKEFNFQVSKRQYPLLKKNIEHYNLLNFQLVANEKY